MFKDYADYPTSCLQSLMRDATENSFCRGHDIVWLWRSDALLPFICDNNAKCKKCDAWVYVTTKPDYPNLIAIDGSAITRDCPERYR